MCGRARCSSAPEEFAGIAGVPAERWRDREKYVPEFNAGPGNWMPILKNGEDGQRELHTMKWGLVPSHTKIGTRPDYFQMFNARSETMFESPVYRKLIPSQRCIVYVNGFYEWHQETETRKQPYYVRLSEDRIVKFAGLYDCWNDSSSGELLFSFTIITTACSPRIEWLHNRMPVLLDSEVKEAAWLDMQNPALCGSFFEPYNGADLLWHPVTHAMGKRSVKGPQCCRDVRQKGIGRFFQKAAHSPSQKGKPKEDGASQLGRDHSTPGSQEDPVTPSKAPPPILKSPQGERSQSIPKKRKVTALSQSSPLKLSASPASGKKGKTALQPTLKAYFSTAKK